MRLQRSDHLAGGGSVIAAVTIASVQVACLGGGVTIAVVSRLAVGLIAALTLLRGTVPIAIASTAGMHPADQ